MAYLAQNHMTNADVATELNFLQNCLPVATKEPNTTNPQGTGPPTAPRPANPQLRLRDQRTVALTHDASELSAGWAWHSNTCHSTGIVTTM
jgi:hypothetical protein